MNRQHGPETIWIVLFHRVEDRIIEIYSKVVGLRESERVPSLSEQPYQGRCRRTTQPNGGLFWSFTWSEPGTWSEPDQNIPYKPDATQAHHLWVLI